MEALFFLIGLIGSLIVSIVSIPLITKFAISHGIYDNPTSSSHGRERMHKKPIPRLGGVAIFGSFILVNLIVNFGDRIAPLVLISSIIFLVGLLDDIYSLPALVRLVVQSFCAIFVVWKLNLAVSSIALSPNFSISLFPWLGFSLAVFIILGAINSTNMIDGLDGLAGGLVLIGLTALSFLYFLRTHETDFLLFITFPIIGSILGFLKYNTHPASIFMGDSGSNWLGFILGVFFLIVLGDYVVQKDQLGDSVLVRARDIYGSSQVPFVSLVLCLAVPIIDSACVILSRFKNSQKLMAPDNRHFHHTLIRLGFSHSQSVTTMYFIAAAAGVAGLLPVQFPQYNFFWIPYAVVCLLLIVIPLSPRTPDSLIEQFVKFRVRVLASKALSTPIGRIVRYWEGLNRYLIYSILIISSALSGIVSEEIGVAALIMAVLLLFVHVFGRGKNGDFLDSLILSLGTVVLLVANNQNVLRVAIKNQIFDVQGYYNLLFIILLVSTALMFVMTVKRRYMEFTPSDFLLLTIPLILMLVPEPFRGQYRFNIICLRSLIVFMALRNMTKRRYKVAHRVRLLTILALLYIGFTSVFGLRLVY